MAHKKIQFNPGFYKLFDEIVVNARDARIRSIGTANPIKHIDVCVLVDTVRKDGAYNQCGERWRWYRNRPAP
jgi:hypothetical protein